MRTNDRELDNVMTEKEISELFERQGSNERYHLCLLLVFYIFKCETFLKCQSFKQERKIKSALLRSLVLKGVDTVTS